MINDVVEKKSTVETRYNEIFGTGTFLFIISVVNKQYKTKEFILLGPEKLVCYIRYFVIIRFLYIEFPLYRQTAKVE